MPFFNLKMGFDVKICELDLARMQNQQVLYINGSDPEDSGSSGMKGEAGSVGKKMTVRQIACVLRCWADLPNFQGDNHKHHTLRRFVTLTKPNAGHEDSHMCKRSQTVPNWLHF